MTVLEAIENLFRASRGAHLTAEGHVLCQESKNVLVAALAEKTESKSESEPEPKEDTPHRDE